MITDIQNLLTQKLQNNFPSVKCYAYAETLFEDTDNFLSYNAPAIFIVILPPQYNLTQEERNLWDCRLSWGVIITTDQTSQEEGVKEGWDLSEKVSEFLSGNRIDMSGISWRLDQFSFAKQERKNRDGTPTGVYYWPLTFTHLYNYDNRI